MAIFLDLLPHLSKNASAGHFLSRSPHRSLLDEALLDDYGHFLKKEQDADAPFQEGNRTKFAFCASLIAIFFCCAFTKAGSSLVRSQPTISA